MLSIIRGDIINNTALILIIITIILILSLYLLNKIEFINNKFHYNKITLLLKSFKAFYKNQYSDYIYVAAKLVNNNFVILNFASTNIDEVNFYILNNAEDDIEKYKIVKTKYKSVINVKFVR